LDDEKICTGHIPLGLSLERKDWAVRVSNFDNGVKLWRVYRTVHACSGAARSRVEDAVLACPTIEEAERSGKIALGENFHSVEEY
jgi:hypothetical protein